MRSTNKMNVIDDDNFSGNHRPNTSRGQSGSQQLNLVAMFKEQQALRR